MGGGSRAVHAAIASSKVHGSSPFFRWDAFTYGGSDQVQTPGETLNTIMSSFQFVTITNPREIRSENVRKLVRSHVTTQQHDRQRQKCDASRWLISHAHQPQADEECEEIGEREEDMVDDESVRRLTESAASSCLSRTSSNPYDKAFSQGTVAFQVFALDDQANTTGITLSKLRTDASTVLVSVIIVAGTEERIGN